MTLTLVKSPFSTPVSLNEAKAHLRVDHAHEDELISRLIDTATAQLDGRDGTLGRALLTQTWALSLDAFPPVITLPLPPCKSVDEITYISPDGSTQMLESALYTVTGVGAAGSIRPAYGVSWPETRAVAAAVRVTFTAGYGIGSRAVPSPIRSAMLLQIAHLYEHRESITSLGFQKELPHGYGELVDSYRIWSF